MKSMQEFSFESEPFLSTCAFTGHRFLGKDFSEKKLKKEIERVISMGVTDFYNGMAMGFDLLAAEIVLSLKKKYPQIRLICCVPFYGQEKYYSDEDKKRYVTVLKKADISLQLSDQYTKDCMHKRNRYMADWADILIAYCNKPTGGTAYTVEYFHSVHPEGEIVFI